MAEQPGILSGADVDFTTVPVAAIPAAAVAGGGGGGGGGAATVTSLTALAASASSLGAVYLAKIGLAGLFVWGAGNFSAQVTADPVQAITVAPTSDPTGASGAWLRLIISPLEFDWFGADGTTANTSAALDGFGKLARYLSSLGNLGQGGIELHITPVPSANSIYQYDLALCKRWLVGIPRLRMYSKNAVFQNVTTNASWKLVWEFAALPIFGPNGLNQQSLIQSTTGGNVQNTITCITPTDAGKYLVGASVMVGSIDTQYNGFPPNLQQFEFAKVTANNTSTGAVTLDRNLDYSHLSTYPDGTGGWGAARIWQLDIDFSSLFSYLGVVPWDVEHVYEGLKWLNPLNAGATVDQSMSGKNLTFRNCKLNAHSPTIAGTVILDNCSDPLLSEPDKLVKNLIYIGGDYFSVPLQSASVENVIILGGNFQSLGTMGKYFFALGAKIGSLSVVSGGFGQNVATTIQNCNARKYSSSMSFQSGAGNRNIFITGATTYANGVISQPFNNIVAAVPGQKLNFSFTGSGQTDAYSGDIGDAVVLGITQSSTYDIQTSLQSAALPTFCTDGKVYLNPRGKVSIIGCTGNADIARASEACANGGKEFGHFADTIVGKSATGGEYRALGTWKYALVNVRVPAVGISLAKLTIHGNFFLKTSPTTFAPIVLTIDLTVAGLRIIDFRGDFGFTGADAFTVNGSAATALSQLYFQNGNALFTWTLNYTPSAQGFGNLPTVDIINQFDTGLFDENPTNVLDPSGAIIAGITGPSQ